MQLVDLPDDEKAKAEQEHAPSALPKIISTGFKVRHTLPLTGPAAPPTARARFGTMLRAPHPHPSHALPASPPQSVHLIYFFTAGEDEVKCWQIKRGTKAPQAAGTIHTDFERGFICAEVMT